MTLQPISNFSREAPAIPLQGLLLLFLVTIVGCGRGSGVAAPVDSAKARETLELVLTDWQKGGSLEAWQKHEPQIVVQDFDWMNGAELSRYEILGPGQPRDANLVCEVKLFLKKPPNREVQRTVTYVVGTDPVLTVFRDAMN